MAGTPPRAKRLFGTNGVRGEVGKDMHPDLVLRIGMALGSLRGGSILVGRDTRTSGPALSSALQAGLMATGCRVADAGVVPTPALQYAVAKVYDAGAMVTASHNPPEYNGVKIIDTDGTEMGDDEIILLEDRILADRIPTVAWDRVGTISPAPHIPEGYVQGVCSHFPGAEGEGMTVVVDPGSGAGCATTPAIMTGLGCRVHTLNARMDGTFPGRDPEPTAETLAPLAEMVKATGAAFGAAHDGDADRTVFVDGKGRYLEENREFAMIARHLLRNRRGTIVMPVSTSRLVEKVACASGCRVDYTPVGSIYVARRMRELLAAGTPVVMGGEGNGGLIFPDHQFCRDGGMTAAMMVSLLSSTGQSLSALADELPAMILIKEKIRSPRARDAVAALEKAFSGEDLDRTDGIRLNRDDAWALVRPSGTEPLLRILVEAEDRGRAEALHREIRNHLRDAGI
ncbi:MAG: phosphoglucosamine mutase [Methanomicrobiales archaeon]|nr:phosphoglucosamine mutase [Methanomicrobiales archaeon]